MDFRAAGMGAGTLSHRVTLYAPEGTYGAGSPAAIATGLPARISAPSFQQQERLQAGGLQGQTVYLVTMRYRDDVTMDLELVEECCNERRLRIHSMIQSDRRELLELTCVVAD